MKYTNGEQAQVKSTKEELVSVQPLLLLFTFVGFKRTRLLPDKKENYVYVALCVVAASLIGSVLQMTYVPYISRLFPFVHP